MLLYEINSRLDGLTFDGLDDEKLRGFKNLHFDALWLMGVWQISPLGVALSKKYAPDFVGSPYAIHDYQFNPELGDAKSFHNLRKRANKLGLKIILDFVPNHLALDAPLIDEHPGWFIQSDPAQRTEYDLDYYRHPSGKKFAHGKDPNFAGWNDTVQLNYTSSGLRRHMEHVLRSIAAIADGVRCDMAMLILRDQIKRQWFPNMSQERFDTLMPNEFWPEAVTAAKKVNPDFIFLAEAYWDTETYLHKLGFRYTYHKRLYDLLLGDDAERVNGHLRHFTNEFLQHCVHFIENHDEDRAAAKFKPHAVRRAAALTMLMPGMALIHQGQMEGVREKIPVQRVKPLEPHVPDENLRDYHADILGLASAPIFRQGKWAWADSNWKQAVCFWRRHEKTTVLVLIPVGDAPTHPPKVLYTSPPPSAWIPAGQPAARSGWNPEVPITASMTGRFLTVERSELEKGRRWDVFCLEFSRGKP